MIIHDIESDARHMYEVLLSGGLALARTETGYGLVAMRPQAVRRIYELKGRPAEKPCVTVGSLPILDDVVTGIDLGTRQWLDRAVRAWPMALVARVNPSSRLLASFDAYQLGQCTKAGTIATFYGVGELISRTAEIARQDARLIVGSSANLAGTGNNYSLDAVPESMRSAADVVFDYGRSNYESKEKLASTILDVTTNQFLRRGMCFNQVEASWQAFQASRAPWSVSRGARSTLSSVSS